jgi:hypothetical protein
VGLGVRDREIKGVPKQENELGVLVKKRIRFSRTYSAHTQKDRHVSKLHGSKCAIKNDQPMVIWSDDEGAASWRFIKDIIIF